MAQRPVLSVLAIPSFRSLWFGQIASQLAMNMLLFILGLVIYRNTQSNAAVSGLFLAYGLPAVVFGMLAGTVVDRLDRRVVLLVCDLARLGILIPLALFSSNVPLVYFLVCVHAIISQFYVPAEAPLIPRLVHEKHLVSANSLFSFTYYTSMALGFVLAGPVFQLAGAQGGLVAIGTLFLLAAFFVSRIPPQGEGIRSFMRIAAYPVSYLFERVKSNLLAGVHYVSHSRALKDALVLLTGTQIILAMLGTLGPGFADRVLGVDIAHASTLIIGPVVLGIILGALWVGNVGYRLSTSRLIRTGVLGAGILLVAIAVASRIVRISGQAGNVGGWSLLLFVVLFFMLGLANSFLDVPANSVLQKESDSQMRGRVYGVLTAAVGGVGILPVVAGGFLADAIGVGKVIFILGVVVLSYGILRLRYNRS